MGVWKLSLSLGASSYGGGGGDTFGFNGCWHRGHPMEEVRERCGNVKVRQKRKVQMDR